MNWWQRIKSVFKAGTYKPSDNKSLKKTFIVDSVCFKVPTLEQTKLEGHFRDIQRGQKYKFSPRRKTTFGTATGRWDKSQKKGKDKVKREDKERKKK